LLNTIENSNDFDGEYLSLQNINQFSNLKIFENLEIEEPFLISTEDGHEYGESPISTYTISDYIVKAIGELV
jgi:hypothetical protein